MKKRLIIFFMVVILAFSYSFCGCGKGAINSAEVYCSLLLKMDFKDSEKFGISETEKNNLVKEYEDNIKKNIQEGFILNGNNVGGKYNDSLFEAYKQLLSKADYEIKQVSKSGNKAEIEISTNYCEIRKVDEKAAMDTLDELAKINFKTQEEESQKFDEVYKEKLLKGLQNEKLSSKKNKMIFNFVRKDGEWQPEDIENFGYKLVRMVVSNKDSKLNIKDEIISPEKSAEVLYNFIMRYDASAIEQFGYSKELGEKVLNEKYKNEFLINKKEFSAEGDIFTDDQIKNILQALRNGLKKNTVKIQMINKDDTTATIKITSNVIDTQDIANKAESTTITQMRASGNTDTKSIMQCYCTNVVNEMNNFDPSKAKVEEGTFKFVKVADIWIPENMDDFNTKLQEMCIK